MILTSNYPTVWGQRLYCYGNYYQVLLDNTMLQVDYAKNFFLKVGSRPLTKVGGWGGGGVRDKLTDIANQHKLLKYCYVVVKLV